MCYWRKKGNVLITTFKHHIICALLKALLSVSLAINDITFQEEGPGFALSNTVQHLILVGLLSVTNLDPQLFLQKAMSYIVSKKAPRISSYIEHTY